MLLWRYVSVYMSATHPALGDRPRVLDREETSMAASTLRRGSAATAGLLGVALALAACGSSSSGAASGTSSAAAPAASASGTSAASAAGSAGAGGDCAAFAAYGSHPGTTVDLASSIRDEQGKAYQDSFADFTKCTGIKVVWDGTADFEAQLPVRVQGGNAPDIALLPQPGLLQTMVNKYKAVKVPSQAVIDQSKANYSKDWIAYGTVNGQFYAPPNGGNVKSFVWYSPAMFKKNNWTIPTTWADLLKLSDTIAATGIKPWCAGFESGTATGWPGTDWIEDFMLRTGTPENYDKWVNHKIPFNDPSVVKAFDEAAKVLKNDKYVNGGFGGVKTIASTAFQDGGKPILDGKCALHRQASFYSGILPKGTTIGEDKQAYAFYLPAIDPAAGKPILGGGEFTAIFNDKPETAAVQLYMGSEEYVNRRAKMGGILFPNNKLKVESILTSTGDPDPILQLSAKILQDPAAVFRFDGSDAMPSAVGAGTFWKGMVKWINGQDTKTTVDDIESSWPKS
jgi:alpha-glucoside transport system substrate-binding protein